jgi:DNA-binding MarR family transcriptional regulator
MVPLTGFVGYALRRAQGVIFADFSETLAELRLRPGHFAILTLISQNPGASQTSISVALGIQKTNFVQTIANLEQRGLVARRRSVSDGRTYELELTARGRRMLLRAAEL